MNPDSSVELFDQQFRRQIAASDYALNPFEAAALAHLRGEVLDYGCGLGNLAIEAARRGCNVTALDASHAAIAHIQAVAKREALSLLAIEADLSSYEIAGDYDAVVCIGLLMFFDCATAGRQLSELQRHVRPGGTAVVNVLTEGTTYMEMFSPAGHCLFKEGELRDRFAGWQLLLYETRAFPAPGNTRKLFATVIARKPHELRTDACPFAQPVDSKLRGYLGTAVSIESPLNSRRTLLAGAVALAACAVRPSARAQAAGREPEMRWYEAAVEMRRLAESWGDQSYGAVLVLDGKVIGQGPSRVVRNQDPDAHAEREAIRDAQRKLGRQRLSGAVLYSTSRPCSLCEAAAADAGVARMHFGPSLTDAGAPRRAP